MNTRLCLLFACWAAGVPAQTPETILVVEARNWVNYSEDVADPQRWATSENPVAPGVVRNFYRYLHLTDIVAVNGKPAKGNLVATMVGINLTPEPARKPSYRRRFTPRHHRDACRDPAG